MIAKICLAMALAGICLADGWGRCPDVKGMSNFDLTKYLGSWAVAASSDKQDAESGCTSHVLEMSEEGDLTFTISE